MDTNNSGNWYSINETLEHLNISRRTLYDWKNKEKIQTKKEGRNRYFWVDDESLKSTESADFTSESANFTSQNATKHLENEIIHLREQVTFLQNELSEQNKRSDLMVLELIKENQKLLERSKTPFLSFLKRTFSFR